MKPRRFRSISEFHRFRQLPPPDHPLVSVVDLGVIDRQKWESAEFHPSGWMLLVHPDLLWHTPLAKTIKAYEFFGYAVHEALFLSEKEEATVTALIGQIGHESRANLDAFSQDILVAQLDLLLNYAQRFYHRQFLTRKVASHRILERLESLLTEAFEPEPDTVARNGLPTVQFLAQQLNISSHYLSDLLKVLTGQTAQQHIHGRLIDKAKQELSTTDLTVTEIAFRLGFGHPQSFNKLFKQKTTQSPLEFRRSVGG